jgi:hypothetical protein
MIGFRLPGFGQLRQDGTIRGTTDQPAMDQTSQVTIKGTGRPGRIESRRIFIGPDNHLSFSGSGSWLRFPSPATGQQQNYQQA